MSENKECETVEIKVERDVEQEKEFVDCIKEEQDEWGDEEAGDAGLYAGREVKHEVVVKEEPVQPNIEFVGDPGELLVKRENYGGPSLEVPAVGKGRKRGRPVGRKTNINIILDNISAPGKRSRKKQTIFICDADKKSFPTKKQLVQHMRCHSDKKPFICDICHKAFSHQTYLYRHKAIHTGEKSYSCDICQKRFTFSGSLAKHKRIHSDEKPHFCQICNANFREKTQLTLHEFIHKGDAAKRFSCKFCKKKFLFQYMVLNHERLHTGDRPFICGICDKRFKQKHQLKVHIQVHTGEIQVKSFICDYCNKSFSNKGNLFQHILNHMGIAKSLYCEICDKIFSYAYISRHRRTHSGEKPYSCDICQKRFLCSGSLKKHKRNHSDEKPHACEVCKKRFKQRSQLVLHALIHQGDAVKRYDCNLCSKKFLHRYQLVKHERVHTGVKPLACNLCSERFNHRYLLDEHLRVHTGHNVYSCEICNESFETRRVFLDHRRTHPEITSTYSFVCDVCDKAFSCKTYLVRHKVVHTGLKPYACNLCDKSYTQIGHLSEHKLTHSGEKPFACENCTMRFTTKRYLVKHVQRIHSGNKYDMDACRVPEKCFPMKKSMAWEFFTDLDHKEKLAQCNFCKKVISYKDGFNLTCHTKSEHPKEFNRVMESDFEHSLASDSQAKVTKQPASLPLPSSSSDVVITQYSHVPATDVSDMLRQQKPFEDEKTKTINKKLVKLFAKHYLPFSLVESAEFKQFVQELNPGYELPSKNMLSDVLIEKYYNETKYTVKDEIDKTDHVALTVDEWYSSNKNEFYIDVTAHFINEEAELKAYILECAQCDYEERQNAEKLAEKLRKICEEWEISNKIVSVTTDDVHNIKSAVALNQWRHVTCFAYSLNLAFQNALDKSKLIHQKVNRVVKFFKRSSFARKRLKRMQDILGEPDLNLKEDVDGQWHTTCAMFERVIEMRNSLHRLFTEDYPDEIFLTNNDLDVIQGVTEVFRFFKDVTKEMSSGRTVTIAEIVYYASALKYKCAECLLDKTLPGRVGNLVRCLDKDLEKQSSNLIHDSLMLESTLLDPRFKKQGFLEFCTNLAARSYIHTSAMKIEIPESSEPLEDITPPPAKKRIGQTLDSTVSEVMETNLASIVQKEMDRYFEEPPLPKNQNPHKWWLSKKIQYPRLYAVACPRLSIPATSVPPEQIFLKSGRILTESRNRLSGYEAERLVFLNKNL